MRFKNKIVLVTGSSRGIGRATAILFAQEGAKVIVNYSKSKKEADKVVEEIKKRGSDAIAIQCDVSNEKQVKIMFEQASKKFGRVDILVNNAGFVVDKPFFERDAEEWKKIMDINLLSVYLCTKYARQSMLKQKYGKIINISSTNGIDTFSTSCPDYDAAKAGVILLTRNLAKELAPHIQVNSVAPGWIDTEMNKDLPKDFIKEEIEKIYVKRMGKPEEIAKVVLFLASEDASFISGQTLKVDGGCG
ncbi:MAG: 3-oxoacyl-ACP reductase family protein [bacterium]|nr:3-oxoacyl-ACP reductase family protein [bacterium]